MGQINDKLRSLEGAHFMFFCPGCKDTHVIGKNWTFDGNFERPTVAPSLLVRCGHYAYDEPQETCWCTYNRDNPSNPARFHCYRCHSFIKDGLIQFLSDCTHELAGQTVPLASLPDWLRDP